MSSVHGAGQQGGTELPGKARGNGILKEKPGMRAVSGTGTLQGHGDAKSDAYFPERCAVPLPAVIVKINRQKVAHLVPAQGVEAGDDISPQMRLDDLFVQGVVSLMPAVETFDRRFPAEARFPFVPANRCIPRPAFPVLPSFGVNILPPFEQRHKQPDLLRRVGLSWDSRLRIFSRRVQSRKSQWQMVSGVLRRIRSRRVGYSQLRLQDFILFPQRVVFGKQCPAFFKQIVDIHNGSPFTFLRRTSSRQSGIQIREKPSRGMNRKSQSNVAFRRI